MGHPIAEALLAVSLGLWAVIEIRQALNRRSEATSADRGSFTTVRLSYVLGILVAALAHGIRAAAFPYITAVFGVSLCFVWAGIGLRLWSFRTLGHYFTFRVMTSPDQQVITSGPYRFVRHPSYAGILLVLTGIGISYGNWLSLAAIVLIPLLGFINRIRVEEAALSTALGARYTAYASSRKRLIPFVW